MTSTAVRVVNILGEDVVNNGLEQGEIIVKGDGVMNNDIVNNNRTYTNGWLRTGDKGTIDGNGSIKIITPNKDLTINSGENVSSLEIENALYKHPAIQEAVILLTPDRERGDILHGFVVLNNGFHVTEQELIHFLMEHISESSCPKAITIMTELPKTKSGKILKVQLQK